MVDDPLTVAAVALAVDASDLLARMLSAIPRDRLGEYRAALETIARRMDDLHHALTEATAHG